MGGNCVRRERTGSGTPTWQKHGDIGGKVETLYNILEYKKALRDVVISNSKGKISFTMEASRLLTVNSGNLLYSMNQSKLGCIKCL